MGVLDQVTQMREKGMGENEIVSSLQQQGVSPKLINDALNQSQIKTAVSDEKIDPAIKREVPPEPPESTAKYTPQAREIGEIGESYAPAPLEPVELEEDYPQEEYDEYGGYGGYAPEMSTGTDVFIELAEQVFSEKIKQIQEQLERLNEFKSLAEVKLDHALERIKRIESAMDKLQIAILDKVGSYGKTLESIKKEMSMMQDSFRKTLPSLAEKASKPAPQKTTKKISKKK